MREKLLKAESGPANQFDSQFYYCKDKKAGVIRLYGIKELPLYTQLSQQPE